MPTKEVLETENAELRAEVEILRASDASAMAARVKTLETEKAELTATFEAAKRKTAEESAALIAGLTEKAERAAAVDRGDYVVLGGVRHAILHRNTVKELSQDLHRRFVEEDATALVVGQKGG